MKNNSTARSSSRKNYSYDSRCGLQALTAEFVNGTPSNPSGTTRQHRETQTKVATDNCEKVVQIMCKKPTEYLTTWYITYSFNGLG
jgi:hypothetical protein